VVYISLSASLALAATFGLAAASKVRALGVFAEQIADYRMVPYASTRHVALLVVLAEGLSCLLLLLAPTRAVGAVASTVVLVVFLGALVRAWRSGRKISCACFGGGRVDTVGAASVTRTTALLLFALASFAAPHDQPRPLHFLLAALLLLLVFVVSELVRLLVELRPMARRLVPAAARADR
jgi:Methylamine utilisation protein MauE